MAPSITRQAERLFQVFSQLVRAYQFRDREGITCHGLSVSQCYTLDTLAEQGPTTMGDLARHLHLEISSMTRIVDSLVSKGWATRAADRNDRRVCRVRASRKGKALVDGIREDLIAEHRRILQALPADSREDVIKAMSSLLEVFTERQQRSCTARKGADRRKRKVG